MKNFNKLSPAQTERLALLSEELGETQQAIGKILRHGYCSVDPTATESINNRHQLEVKLGDIAHAMELMCRSGDLSELAIASAANARLTSVKKYLHHQENY